MRLTSAAVAHVGFKNLSMCLNFSSPRKLSDFCKSIQINPYLKLDFLCRCYLNINYHQLCCVAIKCYLVEVGSTELACVNHYTSQYNTVLSARVYALVIS